MTSKTNPSESAQRGSRWKDAFETYHRLEAEGKLDAIDSIPDEIDRRAEDAAAVLTQAGDWKRP